MTACVASTSASTAPASTPALAGEAVLPHFAGAPLSLPQLSGGLKQPVEGAIQGGDAGHVHVSGKTAAPESRPPNARATEKT